MLMDSKKVGCRDIFDRINIIDTLPDESTPNFINCFGLNMVYEFLKTNVTLISKIREITKFLISRVTTVLPSRSRFSNRQYLKTWVQNFWNAFCNLFII